MNMKPYHIGSALDVLGGNVIVEIMILFFNYLLWKISHKYKSRENNVMNSHGSITQLQQLSIHGQSCFICATIHLPTVTPDYFKASHYDIISSVIISVLIVCKYFSVYL